MKVLVTGGAGFIGSHLVERLLADGHAVTVVDNFSSGRVENLAHLQGHPALRVDRLDMTHHDEMKRLCEGIDWVFHLAALADIVPSIQRPLDYYQANVSGTASVVEAARLAGVKRFVYTASSSCYGITDTYPTPEEAPIRPQYPYALTKWLGEQLVLHWAQVYRLPAVSLRLFNVYGPLARTTGAYGAVFGVFLAQTLAGKPLTVVGDGSQTRDFTFVTDVVEAFVRAAESHVRAEVFNVGSGKTSSVARLASLLGGPVVHVPKRPGEPDCTWADTSRIRRVLGWEPRVGFEEGVRRMLEHLNDWSSAPVWTPESIAEATKDWFRYLSPAAAAG